MRLISFISSGFNVRKQARELGVPIWQAPTVLFLFMGLIIVVFMIVVYFTSRSTGNPYVLIFSEIGVVTVTLIVGGFVIRLFEELARTNKTKSEFIAVASHQMRSPLAQMKWLLELFHEKYDDQVDENGRELVKKIENSNRHLIRLAGDLLDAARIEQGEVVVIKTKIDAMRVIRRSIRDHAVLAESKNIQMDVKLYKKAVWVLADAKRLGIVIDNIISNAIKYTPKDGLIEVRCKDVVRGLELCVKDNGIGIAEREQQRIFEKFFRADNTTQVDVVGTGLGLYLAKNIIDQLGGKIWFKSIEGVGTLFCVQIPYYSESKNISR